MNPNEKRKLTNIERYGSEEAYHIKLREWGRTGGRISQGRFQKLTPEERSEISRKGGSVPRVKQ
jgi:general stress protein YciG